MPGVKDIPRSTIYREKRNTGQRGYRAQQAAKFTKSKTVSSSSSMTAFALPYIDYLIGLDWSPEQISGALTQHGWLDVRFHMSGFTSTFIKINQKVVNFIYT